ncbi:WD40 repeat-like protein [Neolentinus lepideus HHB14362 ss-1]|uniref:WD40 repeat-like protein n=1 Tax=Neolentinus lepideus HHB14362 ss-1 TaxID=1314782 RepID=A0A165PBX9_9AGAM|nr:WD40 repeat-like protein [Neolentinus lepideus HHB14362 ss-1]
MNLQRHSITATKSIRILDARFDADSRIFTCSTPTGFAVYRMYPLTLLRKRELTGGTLAAVLPFHSSNLLFLLGGGRSPFYPPNKVILWDDSIGKEVAELEFRERVRGFACRRGWLAVAVRRRVVLFEVGQRVSRYGEWDTCDNPRGLVALATAANSTLLAIPGRQTGHVQLIHLPPCQPPGTAEHHSSSTQTRPPPQPTRHPVSIIAAHTGSLSTLSVPASGKLLATASSKGTLVRVWDSYTGKLVREFRRGTDKAEIYGVAFRPDEKELCVWSDKGTIHVFAITSNSGASNRQSSFSPLTPYLPLPKYFDSEWSYAQYRIPTQSPHASIQTQASRPPRLNVADEERCVVAWTDCAISDREREYQLIALTYSGGWYRLSLPGSGSGSGGSAALPSSPLSASPPRLAGILRPGSPSASTFSSRAEKGKEKDKEGKEGHECTLREFRRYGRWDGWG